MNTNILTGGDKPIRYPLRDVVVIAAGWFALGKPVSVGEALKLPADEALLAQRLGRVEFAP